MDYPERLRVVAGDPIHPPISSTPSSPPSFPQGFRFRISYQVAGLFVLLERYDI